MGHYLYTGVVIGWYGPGGARPGPGAVPVGTRIEATRLPGVSAAGELVRQRTAVSVLSHGDVRHVATVVAFEPSHSSCKSPRNESLTIVRREHL